MSTLKTKVVKATCLDDGETGRLIGTSLKKLRELAGLTQQEMATRLDIGQASISKIERRGDVHIHSLERYVAALGATLRIEATFPATQQIADQFNLAFDPDTSDDNQLVFPIFGDDVFRKQRDVVLSIRPYYSNKILDGRKTVELRRRFPVSAPRGTLAYIYSTSPVRAIVACANISQVHKLPLDQLWKAFRRPASITKSNFYDYFNGLQDGFAIEFSRVQPLSRPLTLEELRERFSFAPPQSFLYATPKLRKAIRHEFTKLPH